MKKRGTFYTRLFSFLLLAMPLFLYGQNFTVTPNDTVLTSINSNESKEAEIDVHNSLGHSISVTWEVMVNTLPSCWTTQLCDNATCFTVLPSSHQMDSIVTASLGYLKLTVTLHEYGGSGVLQLYVYETSNPSAGDTVTFIVNGPATNCPLGLKTTESSKRDAGVYPNPVSSELFYRNGSMASFNRFEIFNVIGNQVMSGTLNEYQRFIAVSDLSPGVYLVRFATTQGTKFSTRFIKKQNEQ